jgi:hypothetical protein
MRSPFHHSPAYEMPKGWQCLVTKPQFTLTLASPDILLLILAVAACSCSYSASRCPSCLPSTIQISQAAKFGRSYVFRHCPIIYISPETMIESHRRKVLGALNSRYIYGKVVSTFWRPVCTRHESLNHCLSQPLLHTLVFLLQIAIMSIVTRRFNSYYAARPGMYSKRNKCRIDC